MAYNMQKIIKTPPPFTIYLADLRYFVGGTCFPLAAGYLAAYIGKVLPQICDVRIFIDPEKLMRAIREAPPDMLGLTNYSWNRNINTQVTAFAKSINPQTVTVMGGPCFARDDKDWLRGFFLRNENLDFYIAGAGEFAFAEMVKLVLERESGRQEVIREGAFPGLFFRDDSGIREGQRQVPSLTERRKSLDEIPSPYLLGLFDEFFDYENLGPMIETVRGCPYACTFCCWGSRLLSKVSMFSLDRVKAELDYVAKRSVNCSRLFFGDANFGIIERDIDVAEHLMTIRERSGWPNDVYLYFAKNSGERVIKISSLLKDMTSVTMSRQSMNDEVLTNTKRANLDDKSYARIQTVLGENNIESMVEFIYPLPGETRKSFVDGLELLFEQVDPLNTEIRFYPTEMLPGSEMATEIDRKKFGLKTGWRRLSGHSGTFDGVSACEYQEIVVATNDFSFSDQLYVRKLHFLLGLFFTYRLYAPIMKIYVEALEGRGPVFLLNCIIDRMSKDPVLNTLIASFETDTTAEFVYEGEPAADGKDAAGDKKQRRHNIYYILTLFFGEGGVYRAAFEKVLKDILVEEVGIGGNEVDLALMAFNANFIDYNTLNLETGEGLADLSQHPAVSAFMSAERTEVIDTLYRLYSEVTGGYLERMILRERTAHA